MRTLLLAGLLLAGACSDERTTRPTAAEDRQLNDAEQMLDLEAATLAPDGNRRDKN